MALGREYLNFVDKLDLNDVNFVLGVSARMSLIFKLCRMRNIKCFLAIQKYRGGSRNTSFFWRE